MFHFLKNNQVLFSIKIYHTDTNTWYLLASYKLTSSACLNLLLLILQRNSPTVDNTLTTQNSELELVRDMKSNEKGFCRYVASKRKATVSMDLLIYVAREPRTTGTERAEVLIMLSCPTLIPWSSLARFAPSSTRCLNLLAECVGKKSPPPIHEDTGSSHKLMHAKDTTEAVWCHCKATLYHLWWLFSGDSRKAIIFFMKGRKDVGSYIPDLSPQKYHRSLQKTFPGTWKVTQKQPEWLYQRWIMSNQPDCLLWDDWLCGQRKSSDVL